jgi:hypothetical protein
VAAVCLALGKQLANLDDVANHPLAEHADATGAIGQEWIDTCDSQCVTHRGPPSAS